LDTAPLIEMQRHPKVLGNVTHGRHPLHGLLGVDGLELGQFIDEIYVPWAKANRRYLFYLVLSVSRYTNRSSTNAWRSSARS
jgi:hypothetical protein